MIRRLSLPAAAALALACFLPASTSSAEEKKGGTVELFNGKDLDGWRVFVDPGAKDVKPEDVWSVRGEVIHCKGKPNGYLITEKEYGDYVLRVQWRFPDKPGNSGVFVHVSGPDKIWPKAVEAQLFADHAGDIWLVDGFKLKVDEKRQDPKQARHFLRMGKVGLASMRERAELGGGTLVVQSRPGAGTIITATLPFEILAAAPRPR